MTMTLRFDAKHTFLHVYDVEHETVDEKKRSTSLPAVTLEKRLDIALFEQQRHYAEFLTKAENDGCLLGPRHHRQQQNHEDSRSSTSRITTGMRFHAPCKHVSDDDHSSKCTPVALHRSGSATDVPKHTNTIEGCVTLMICNIPCGVLCKQLAAEFDSKGFEGKYDLLHLPGVRRNSNLGYGFINFRKQEDAMEFAKEFSGHLFAGNSKKKIEIKPAKIQGQQCRVAHKQKHKSRSYGFY